MGLDDDPKSTELFSFLFCLFVTLAEVFQRWVLLISIFASAQALLEITTRLRPIVRKRAD